MRHRDEDAGGVGGGPVTPSAPRTPAAADGPAASPEAGVLPFAFRITGSKLCRPQTRADAVYRRRLVELLLLETAPLILVSAPSGSGKTIAVSQWIEAEPRPSAWLQLDRGDNDPVTLLQYLARVLEDVAPVPAAVYSWLRLSRPPVAEAIVPALVFAAAAAPPLALVLDDVHRVSDPRSWAAAWPVLASLPEGSTVVVCGRADPPLPLARLRTEGQLAEYRFPELAFDAGEVAELVRLRGVRETPELVEDLQRTAEGWAAGLYLGVTALARERAREQRSTAATARKEVGEYVVAEVLAEEPPEVVDFLLRTSLVERLSAGLCDVLTGRSDGFELLRRVERENLFVVALDPERGWYRYHRLFAAALQAELQARRPDEVPELHRRAAAWFQACDHVREAVHHWLAAGDPERAGDLVAARWVSRYDSGRLLTARLWLDEFSPGQIAAHAPLAVAAAWVRALTGEASAAAHLLGALDTASLDRPSPDGMASVRASAALLSASLGSGGALAAREQARLAARLEREGGHVALWSDFVNHILGVSEALCGDLAAAEEALMTAARPGCGIRSSIELGALGHLSLLAGDAGRWDEAERYVLEAAAKAAEYELEDYLPNVPARIARDRLGARAGDDDAPPISRNCSRASTPGCVPGWGRRSRSCSPRSRRSAATRRAPGAGSMRPGGASSFGLRPRSRPASPSSAAAGRGALVEPVSAAEMRVLELLPSYLTLGEIAARLSVSPNTVASHVRSLHRKLGATSRSGTVQRAVDLGLLASRRGLPGD